MMIPNPSSDPLRRLHSPLVPEIKAEIGAALKAARLKKSQSLEAVCQQTRISKRFLEALEENRFDEFPALAYLRGFLKSYCDYLELDFEAYWRVIQSDAPAEPQKESAAAPAAPKTVKTPSPAPHAAHAPHPTSPSSHAPAPRYEPDPSAILRAVLFGAVLTAVVALAVTRRGTESKVHSEAGSPIPSLLQPVQQPVQPDLKVEMRQDAWLSMSADGRTVFEGRAPRNSVQKWTAKKTLLLRTPEPEALQLTLNGKRYVLPPRDASGDFVIESP